MPSLAQQQATKTWREKNREYDLARKRTWYQANKSRHRDAARRWKKNNPDKVRVSYKKHLANNPLTRVARNLRRRLLDAFKSSRRTGSAIKLLGCTIPEFRTYLESKFQIGMSWDNYGQWHIDHIKPLSLFDLTNKEQIAIACHYTNLQPLWAVDNIRKGNKVA